MVSIESGNPLILARTGPSNSASFELAAPDRGKVRFTYLVEGHDRQVLSAFQRKNGDLVLALSHAEKYEDGVSILYQRYSVHRSLASDPPLVTLKHTIGLEDGRVIDSAQVRLRKTGDLRAILFHRATPYLDKDRYIVVRKSNDVVVRLHPDEVKRRHGNAFHIALITEPGRQDPAIQALGLCLTTVRFEHFNLVLATGYFHLVPAHLGQLAHHATSSERVSGTPVNENTTVDIRMLSAEELSELTMAGVVSLYASLRNAYRSWLAESDDPLSTVAFEGLLPGYRSAPFGYLNNLPSEVVR